MSKKRKIKETYQTAKKKQKIEHKPDQINRNLTTEINKERKCDTMHCMDITQLNGIEYKWQDNATILYYKTFLDKKLCRELFEELSTLNYTQGEINIYGKKTKLPRLQSWMSDENITSDMTHYPLKQSAHKWTNNMLFVKNYIQKLLNCKFEYVHIHYYRNGNDYIGWHSDKEAKKKNKNIVASISLGATRKFYFRHNDYKKNKLSKKEFVLTDGCLIVMKDDTQKKWKHTIPKSKKLKEPRINLTFRQCGIS